MAKLSKQDLEDLAECIRQAILKEFEDKHLSSNLMRTIQIEAESEDKVKVIIPAQAYNMYKFFKDRVIIPSARGGSYASKLDIEGSSFTVYWGTAHQSKRKKVEPRNHIGYVERVIDDALNDWLMQKKNKWELKSRTEM